MMPPEKAAAVRDIVKRLQQHNLTIRDVFLDPAMFASYDRVAMIRRAHHHSPANTRGSSHDAIGMLLDYIDKQASVVEQQKKIMDRQSARIRLLDNIDDL